MLTAQKFPYTGPYGVAPTAAGAKSSGPTAEALKQALWRLGFLEKAGEFDQVYNKKLEVAFDKFDPGGKDGYGKGRYELMRSAIIKDGPHKGEYAMDGYALTLVQNEVGATSDSSRLALWQKEFASFCYTAVKNGSRWRYNEFFRPVHLDQDPANPHGPADCSSSGIMAADYGRRRVPGLMNVLRDPAKQNWTGYGNTDMYEADWPHCFSPYRIGDIGHFHSARHVIWCVKPGTVQTAEWFSFGHEPPVIFTLPNYNRFPEEWMFAVRPEYIPS